MLTKYNTQKHIERHQSNFGFPIKKGKEKFHNEHGIAQMGQQITPYPNYNINDNYNYPDHYHGYYQTNSPEYSLFIQNERRKKRELDEYWENRHNRLMDVIFDAYSAKQLYYMRRNSSWNSYLKYSN